MRDLQSRPVWPLNCDLPKCSRDAGTIVPCRDPRDSTSPSEKDNINGTKEDITLPKIHVQSILAQNSGSHCVSRNHESHCNDLAAREGVGLAATVALMTQTLERHEGSPQPK